LGERVRVRGIFQLNCETMFRAKKCVENNARFAAR
jgi:hypothetical protein